MTFETLQFLIYRLPFKSSLRVGPFELSSREGILILAKDGQNGVYLSESAPLPGFSKESLKSALNELLEPKPGLLCPPNEFALSGLAKPYSSGDPSILSYIHIQGSKEKMVDEMLYYQNETQFKLKLGNFDPKLAAEVFNKIIQKAKSNSRFRLDFNRSYTKEQLDTFLQSVDLRFIEYIEEPFLNPFELADVMQDVFFALDESLREYPLKDLLKIKNAPYLIIKPTLDMSLLYSEEFKEKVLENSKYKLIFTSSYETRIGLGHISHLAKKHSPSLYHGLDTEKLFASCILDENGQIKEEYIVGVYERDVSKAF